MAAEPVVIHPGRGRDARVDTRGRLAAICHLRSPVPQALLRLLQAVRATLDVGKECLPGLRAEGQVAVAGVLGVADSAGVSDAGHLNTVVAAAAVAGFTPPGGGLRGLGDGHRFSFTNSVIMAVDSAGLSAFCRRWVQARLYRSSSSLDSRYRSPNSPSA